MKLKMNTQLQIVENRNDELDQDLTFEVSKEVKVVTKVTYKKGDIIGQLINEIKSLKSQVDKLEGKRILITKESLIKLWDNKYDDKWNEC